MNALERFNSQQSGKPLDRFLNFDIFMGFGAHYIGQPLRSYYLDYRILCDATLAVQTDFNLDIVQVISDPYREAVDAGLEVEFPQDSLPLSKRPLLQDPGDIEQLCFPKPENGRRMSDRLEAVRRLHEKVGREVPVMGWVEGALAEAADLRGISQMLMDLSDQPQWIADLLERCTENAIAFARAQVEAGALIIGLGDAIASQISPRMYRMYALPYEQRIFAAVREMGAVPRLHICGNTSRILNNMAASGAEIVDLDWMVDLKQARQALGDLIICGNLDPVSVFLQGDPQKVTAGVRANIEAAAPRWISAGGCEIPDKTAHANLHAQTRALNEWKG
jgi:MtaA/CmuA family methyltransferase